VTAPVSRREWPTKVTPRGETAKDILMPEWKECLKTNSLLRECVPWTHIAPEISSEQNKDELRSYNGILVSKNGSIRLRPDQIGNYKQLRAYEALIKMQEERGYVTTEADHNTLSTNSWERHSKDNQL